MEIKLLTKKEINQIKDLYKQIKEHSYTLWDENYPNEELIFGILKEKVYMGYLTTIY